MSRTWEFQQFPPPRADGKFDPKLYKNPDWYAEEKLDGDRRIAQFVPVDGHAMVRFTGRRVSEVDGLLVEKTSSLPHLNGCQYLPPEALTQKWPLQNVPTDLIGTVLDGEMIVDKPGARSKDVASILNSKPDLAIAKQVERGWLVYVVFDCLFYKGEDLRKLPLIRRRRYLRTVLEEWANPFVRIVPNTTLLGVSPEQMLMEIWSRPHPGEGIILKDLTSVYGNEKAWVKVKREFTEDVVIMGYDDPEPETEKIRTSRDKHGIKRKEVLEVSESRLAKNGWIGAIRFGQYKLVGVENIESGTADLNWTLMRNGKLYALTYCGSCSGMDDATRAEISANKQKYLGKVVEILANEREPDTGKFRHPRMIQFREDKNQQDCIWGQG